MDDDDDDFIFYGTPLPEIEDETTLRKKAARELEVRDEKGRKRFHGAFTGGFSAGYFNTVGTKEGWAPSTFVSSRSKTADCIQQNPEDFMDEEDLRAFGIATRKIQASYKFQDSSAPEERKRKFHEIDTIIPGEAPLKEIVRPVRDSIGVEILKKLGWRPGQGIGPRVKKHDKNVKVYGCSLPDSTLMEEDDPYALLYTYAPDDTTASVYQPKDDCFGLGYSGLSKASVLGARFDEDQPTFTKSFLKKDKKKLTITGQAFGVGAFEDEDADIYSKDDMSQYDFSEFDLGPKQTPSKDVAKSARGSSSGVVEGFSLASQPSLLKKCYLPPELPADFIPSFAKLNTQQVPQPGPSHQKLTAEERSFLLGEKKFQLAKAPEALFFSIENLHQKPEAVDYTSFQPFLGDSAKQKRYEEFQKLKQSGEMQKFNMPSSMTEWEKQQELEEFSRASMLYKPLAGALSSKFESKSHLSVTNEVIEAIEKLKNEKNQKSSSSKRSLVGQQNRKILDWFPHSLLCRRFNVPNPYPNSAPSGSSAPDQRKSIFSHISFDSASLEQVEEKPQPPITKLSTIEKNNSVSEEASTFNRGVHKTAENTEKKLEETIENKEKPPIDFFKDIFENSSSDEEIDEDVGKDSSREKEETSTTIKITNEPVPKESKEVTETKAPISKKSGFGVFANLDLDALNQRRTKQVDEQSSHNKNIETIEPVPNKSKEVIKSLEEAPEPIQDNNLYGPDLPPNYEELPSVDYSKYVKRHKVKHKHKHKHKNKKKKKKKHTHRSSDDSSSEDEEDIDPLKILEKLKKLQK